MEYHSQYHLQIEIYKLVYIYIYIILYYYILYIFYLAPPFLRNSNGGSIAMSPEDIMRMTLARFDGLEVAFRNRQAELHHEQPRNHGLSSRQIELFPVRKYRPIQNGASELTQCTICLCDYEEGENVRTLPCFHYFHVDCIDSWLAQHSQCPLCKNDVHHYEMNE